MTTQRQRTEQGEANYSGPRAMSEKGSPVWCWQTITALQTQWKSLRFDLDLYKTTWAEAEEHRVWEKVPYNTPFGSKEEMLRRLEVGDIPEATLRVMEQAMDAEPLKEHGGVRRGGEFQNDQVYRGTLGRGNSSARLIARIARDAPEVWERMKQGGFSSVAEAARAAGIQMARRKKTVTLSDNVDRLADRLRSHYTHEQLQRIRSRLG